MTSSQYRHRRSSVPTAPFASPLEPGEIAVNSANRQIAVGDVDPPTVGAPLPMLAVRIFDVRAQYVINDYVIQNGIVYRANVAIAPGAFNTANWTVMANPGTFVLRAGDTMVGTLTLAGAPTLPLHAATMKYADDSLVAAKAYADNKDTFKVSKIGDTMSGPLVLPADPTAPMQATTRQYVDAHTGSAGVITVNPAGGIASTNVQLALEELDNEKYNKTGGRITGNVDVTKTAPVVTINKAASGEAAVLVGAMAGVSRWDINLGDNSVEVGSGNVGSDFTIVRHADGGVPNATPVLSINRASGLAVIAGDPTVPLGVATKGYVDTVLSILNVKQKIFTATGSYIPDPNLVAALLEVQAGGGAGGGATGSVSATFTGGGGGGGAFCQEMITAAQAGSVLGVTVGLGGVPVSLAAGGNGGNSSVGGIVHANGGVGGLPGAIGALPWGGAGGTVGSGDVGWRGQAGATGLWYYFAAATGANLFVESGGGGNAHFGHGARASQAFVGTAAVAGVNATGGYGGGGSGGSANDSLAGTSGGYGAPGIVIITEFCKK